MILISLYRVIFFYTFHIHSGNAYCGRLLADHKIYFVYLACQLHYNLQSFLAVTFHWISTNETRVQNTFRIILFLPPILERAMVKTRQVFRNTQKSRKSFWPIFGIELTWLRNNSYCTERLRISFLLGASSLTLTTLQCKNQWRCRGCNEKLWNNIYGRKQPTPKQILCLYVNTQNNFKSKSYKINSNKNITNFFLSFPNEALLIITTETMEFSIT